MGCSNIEESFREIIESDIPTSLKRLGKELDAQWIENALQESGAGTIRRRKLPAALVVWLVIGMALFRDRSILRIPDTDENREAFGLPGTGRGQAGYPQVRSEKHWLVRGKKNLKGKTLKILGQGDELVELSISSAARKEDPSLPKTMVARVIHYQLSGHKPQFLILPERRRERRYKRHVKIKMSGYKRNPGRPMAK